MADLLSHYNKVPCFSLMSSRILPCNQIAWEVALDAAPYYTNSAEDCAIVFCFFKDTITYSRTKRKNISRSTHHIIKTTCPIIFVYPISFGSATTTYKLNSIILRSLQVSQSSFCSSKMILTWFLHVARLKRRSEHNAKSSCSEI